MPGPIVPQSRRGGYRAVRRSTLAVGLGLALLLSATGAPGASRPAVRGPRAIVVTPEPRATRVGTEVLRRGGNAVDAAVAVAFVLGVTYPLAGCLGGGGFLLYRESATRHHALDFRETAPAQLEPDLFLDERGRPVPGRSLQGGLAVGTPGTVAGLAEAHRRWGSREWKELIEPAIGLAEDGFEVYPWLEETLARSSEKLLGDPQARRIFTRGGRVLREGERLVQQDLARTLRGIEERGAAGFYRGRVASALARRVREAGGVLTTDDLAAYRPVLRRPLERRYRGRRVVSFPPPGGGVVLLQILGILERYDLAASGFGSSLGIHRMAEAERRAFADRSVWLGDPDFTDVPVDALLDPDYLARRAATIADDRATPSGEVGPGHPLAAGDGGETLHFAVGDASGRVVAATLTLNAWYGTGMVAPGTGVLLNNEMDDFALAPGAPNLYGLVGGAANAVAGGKRPLSSMAPTIVEAAAPAPRPLLVLGSPGGATIITSVAQVLVDVLDYGIPLQEAVDAPRFHEQWQPDRILHEVRAFPADVRQALEARGQRLERSPRPIGNVNAIGLDADGAWLGAADPRRHGCAEGL